MTDEQLNRRFDSLAELIQKVAERLDARISGLEKRVFPRSKGTLTG
jgi:hypothetical protein